MNDPEVDRGRTAAPSVCDAAPAAGALPPNSGFAGRPLVVGYVLKMFPRFSETFILNEILELERRGVKVAVFSIKSPNEIARQPNSARVQAPVYILPPLAGRHLWTHAGCHATCFLRSPLRYLRTLAFAVGRGSPAAHRKFLTAPYIVRQARRLGVEHFHAHFASGPARQAKFASMLSGIPFSFTAHAKDLFWVGHQHGRNNKLKKRVRLAAFVVLISEYNRRFVEELGFKVPRRRLVTLYNGLDLGQWTFARPAGLPVASAANGTPLIAAVGRLVEKKGFETLIEACELLRRDGVRVRCVIAGEGERRESLESLIRHHGLHDRVALPGVFDQARLAEDLYLRAALLVAPSVACKDGDQDGIPTVILEAMAVGLPVIATPVSGIGEAITAGETGLLVPPGDARALAAQIRAALDDREGLGRLALGARRHVEMRFDLRQNAKILIHLMTSAARGTPRWSDEKMRERLGLTPPEPATDALGAQAQGSGRRGSGQAASEEPGP